MSDDINTPLAGQDTPLSEQAAQLSPEDAQLQQEIRQGRKFTPEEAIARLAGPGLMKGESPVARLQQAELEIGAWLRTHLADAGGALEIVLHRRLKGCDLLLANFERPLAVLERYCQEVLASDYLLAELVREADIEWGRTQCERPFFEQAGVPPHPDDPYTAERVRKKLTELLQQLATDTSPPA